MNKTNILILNPTGGSPYHGPNMRSYNLAKNLIAQGCSVTIVSNAFFHKFHSFPETRGAFTSEIIDGIPYVWVETTPYKNRGVFQVLNQIQFALKVYLNIRRLNIDSIDCVISSSPPPFAIYPAKKIANKFNAKLIFEIRDLWPEVIQELGGVSKYHPYIWLLKRTVKYAYEKSDFIVSVKEGEIQILNEKYGVDDCRFKYIPNGYDLKSLKSISALPEKMEALFYSIKDKFVVSYVGSLSVAYDIGYFIKAAHLLKNSPDIFFVIAGDGPEENELKEYCAKHKLSNIEFLGRVPGAIIQPILQKASIGFLGYKKAEWLKYGVSSNKIFDYMACKLPIVASLDTPFNPIDKANCGISVSPGDERKLANAILELKNMPIDKLNSLGQNGYNYLCANHSFESIASNYLSLVNYKE